MALKKSSPKHSNRINKNKWFYLFFLFVISILVTLFIFNMFKPLSLFQKPSAKNTLKGVEITQYQGENLSSVNDFIENSIKGPQSIDINSYTLVVNGLVNKPLALTYDQVLKHDIYKKVVTLHCVEGWSVTILWEGVLLKDLLNQAGLKTGANTVIFSAYDGYTSSLPLSYILDNNIILADKMNGVVIPPERGFPFMVVAESKWGYKWVKWVTKIEVTNDPNYKGYWESAGYNQNGDVSGSQFAK